VLLSVAAPQVTVGAGLLVGVEGPVIENAAGGMSMTKLYPLFVALVELLALSVAVTQTYHVPAASVLKIWYVAVSTDGTTG
jgi:hypothetical protein